MCSMFSSRVARLVSELMMTLEQFFPVLHISTHTHNINPVQCTATAHSASQPVHALVCLSAANPFTHTHTDTHRTIHERTPHLCQLYVIYGCIDHCARPAVLEHMHCTVLLHIAFCSFLLNQKTQHPKQHSRTGSHFALSRSTVKPRLNQSRF